MVASNKNVCGILLGNSTKLLRDAFIDVDRISLMQIEYQKKIEVIAIEEYHSKLFTTIFSSSAKYKPE